MENITTDVTAGSSPAPTTGQAVMDSLSTKERGEWAKTGNLPDRVSVRDSRPAKPDATAASSPAASTSAASSPAEPAEQAVSTGTVKDAPASEPGTPQQKRTGHKGNAETRLQELLDTQRRDREEMAALRRELDEIRRRGTRTDARAESSPATPTTQAEYERYLAMPDAPKEEQFESIAKFTAAMTWFINSKQSQERGAVEQMHRGLEREFQAIEQTGAQARERLKAAVTADPSFAQKVHPDLLDVPTESQVRASASALRAQGRAKDAAELLRTINPSNTLAELIAQSDAIDKLLLHFSTDDGRADWQRLTRHQNRDAVLRDFVRLEARLSTAPSAPVSKHVSTAAAPPAVLGTRTAETVDAVDSAMRSKDVARYAREATRRELASLRG